MLIRGAEVDGLLVDVLVDQGVVASIGSGLTSANDCPVLHAEGGALIPGLHDHHLHVMALAAARASVACGPPDVQHADDLRACLHRADAELPRGVWLRGVGFHESVVAGLDRWWIDAVVPLRPVRIQHRSGARWILNSAALAAIDIDALHAPGVERDSHGVPTGLLTGLDAELRGRWPARSEALPVDEVGRELLRYGVTGLTDATPYANPHDIGPLLRAHIDGVLPQRLTVTGAPGLRLGVPSGVGLGPAKIVVGDHDLPDWDVLVSQVRLAREEQRAVAVHCVTRVGLVLALAALDEVGAQPGDRIEHAGVADADAIIAMAKIGLTVVTQPNFIAERGDRYRAEVDPADVDHLYPCGSLIAAGVDVGGSTDAPFGHPDPWRAMRAAVERTTADGHVLGAHERIDAPRALQLFLGSPDAPGGPPRRVAVGAPADLCLLHVPLRDALTGLTADVVAHTVIGGRLQVG